MNENELLKVLLQVPPDLALARQQLKSGRYTPQQVTEVGYQYAAECWNEDLDSDDSEFYSEEFNYYWREPDAISGRHSFYLYEVFELLLQYGLDPNYTVEHDFGILDYVFSIETITLASPTACRSRYTFLTNGRIGKLQDSELPI